MTGLESTYLTAVDLERGLRHVLYSHNAQALQIPESINVPWEETLCKRAGRRPAVQGRCAWPLARLGSDEFMLIGPAQPS